jgi:general secretion pathway protein G
MSDAPKPSRPRAGLLLLVMGVGVSLAVTTAALSLRRKPDPSWARVHADFAAVNDAVERYRAARGALPDVETLDFLVPEFLPTVPTDPWGRPYVYSTNGKQVMLITFGQDGERGGSGVEQDHTPFDGHGP